MFEYYLGLFGNFWNVFELLIFLSIVGLFFSDPVRRWNFFGYRPTAVMGIFDRKRAKVLLVKARGQWTFSQGGIFDPNIIISITQITKRELNAPESSFRLEYTRPLGTIRMHRALPRERMNTISIFRKLRGKGYMACYLATDCETVNLTPGHGIDICEFVSLDEARKRILEMPARHVQFNKSRQQFSMQMLDEIAKMIRVGDATVPPEMEPEPPTPQAAPAPPQAPVTTAAPQASGASESSAVATTATATTEATETTAPTT